MPDKDTTKSSHTNVETTEDVVTDNSSNRPTDKQTPDMHSRRRPILILGIIAGVLLVAMIVGGLELLHTLSERANRLTPTGDHVGFSQEIRANRSPFGYGQSVQTQADNGSVTTTVYNYLTGVVTAVNSDNIVIAGNGKTTTIATNSSTTYDNDTKPAVNDTVVVTGTTSGATITATDIAVNNQ